MYLDRDDSAEPARIPQALYLAWQVKRHFEAASVRLGNVESRLLRRRLRAHPVDRPVYVTGLARAGTTITLELLSHHRDVATHRYRDMAQPYLPYAWNRFLDRLPLPTARPADRLHKDGILVTRDSPEAVEETIWSWYFPGLHDEQRSAVLDATTSNPRFERYYADHIGKLLLAHNRPRYLAKANYNVTRLAYLVRLFPGARFLIVVRHPAAHLVSWLKQHDLISRTHAHDPRWLTTSRSVGHHEFGEQHRFINTGNTEHVRAIRDAWDSGRRAYAFGLYWTSIYGHVLHQIAHDPAVRDATLLVRHEDLCAQPDQTIDRILDHAELDPASFNHVRDRYAQRLHQPRYYRATLDDTELSDLAETTTETATRLGYHDHRPTSSSAGAVIQPTRPAA
jgi:Sulfotransferase family